MIIEGRTHNDAGNLARYLMRGKDGEKVRIVELRDAASADLTEALTDWELCGRALTKGAKIIFHAHLRLRQGEAMTADQWRSAIDQLEQNLKLDNCPRAVVQHNGKEGLHVHVAWSRFNAETEKLAPLSHSRRSFHATARWAEKEFGLSPVDSTPKVTKERRNRRQSERELKAFADRKLNRETLKKRLTAAWQTTVDGEEFHDKLKALGYEIIKGDRRDFVINLDGLKVNPVRLLDGVTEAEFRERMKTATVQSDKISTAMKGRQAQNIIENQMRDKLANDAPQQPKRGFKAKRSKGPTLKPPGWFRGPT